MKIIIIFILLVVTKSSTEQKYINYPINIKCIQNTRYATANCTLNKHSRFDVQINLKQKIVGVNMTIIIYQTQPNGRKYRTFSSQYNLCPSSTNWTSHYFSLYFNNIINEILGDGGPLKCPVEPRQFQLKNFSMHSDIVPYQFFYRPGSSFIAVFRFDEAGVKGKWLGNGTVKSAIRKL